MSTKFTIITPWLPPRHTISRAIECIDSQTYANWEHIVMVDDPAQPASFCEPQNRRTTVVCSTAHKTYGNTCRAIAWEMATGDWIMYLDDDDILYPNALERVAAHIEENPGYEWGFFAILMYGDRFFNWPEEGRITGGQVFHKKTVSGRPTQWRTDAFYSADWDMISRALLPDPPLKIDEILGELPKHHRGEVF